MSFVPRCFGFDESTDESENESLLGGISPVKGFNVTSLDNASVCSSRFSIVSRNTIRSTVVATEAKAAGNSRFTEPHERRRQALSKTKV